MLREELGVCICGGGGGVEVGGQKRRVVWMCPGCANPRRAPRDAYEINTR